MKALSQHLKYILPKIKKAPRTLLFLDYDGTLTPIVSRPSQAVLSSRDRLILKRLTRNKRFILSIVSGRSLRKIKKLVGLKGIYYAGCHGLEIGISRRSQVIPEARRGLAVIKRLKKVLSKELKSIRSAEIEDKGIVLAIHYRRVKKNRVQHLKRLFFKCIKPYLKSKKINLGRGKKVLEVRPPISWDKGKYCVYLLDRLDKRRRGLHAIYIGDDTTDEAAFKVLRKKGITIFIKGEKKTSAAEYYVNSANEVVNFLTRLNLID